MEKEVYVVCEYSGENCFNEIAVYDNEQSAKTAVKELMDNTDTKYFATPYCDELFDHFWYYLDHLKDIDEEDFTGEEVFLVYEYFTEPKTFIFLRGVYGDIDYAKNELKEWVDEPGEKPYKMYIVPMKLQK